jgi:hypothetical protein
VPRLVPPQPQFIAAAPERSVDDFRICIDPEKSGTTDKVVRFEFTDGDEPVVGLHIRRAVAEYLPAPDTHYRTADLVVALTGQAYWWRGDIPAMHYSPASPDVPVPGVPRTVSAGARKLRSKLSAESTSTISSASPTIASAPRPHSPTTPRPPSASTRRSRTDRATRSRDG